MQDPFRNLPRRGTSGRTPSEQNRQSDRRFGPVSNSGLKPRLGNHPLDGEASPEPVVIAWLLDDCVDEWKRLKRKPP